MYFFDANKKFKLKEKLQKIGLQKRKNKNQIKEFLIFQLAIAYITHQED